MRYRSENENCKLRDFCRDESSSLFFFGYVYHNALWVMIIWEKIIAKFYKLHY